MLHRSVFRSAWRPGLWGFALLVAGLTLAGSARAADPALDGASPAAVQEASSGVETLAGAVGKRSPETLWQMIVAGGPLNLAFMAFLGSISLVAAATTMERLVNLTRGKIVPPDQVGGLESLVGANEQRLDGFLEVCDRQASPLANILRAGLLRVGRPWSEIEKALEDGAARELAELRSRVRPLSVAANVAPLVGLLGTVLGMLEAFRIASQAGLGKAELLAEGIYLALETTVAGLLIAIPASLFASYFHSRSERFVREIGDCLNHALPVLAALAPGKPSPAAAPTSARSNPLMVDR